MAGEVAKKEDSVTAPSSRETVVQKVKVMSTTKVKPKKTIGRREFQLVTFDLPYLSFFYNQKLLIYKNDTTTNNDSEEFFKNAVEKLKEGLATVLDHEFYQLAGKLGKDEEGIFRVEYDDDNDNDDTTEVGGGVEVVEAVAEDVEVADLTDEEGSRKFKDFIPYNHILNLEGLHRPLLSVQLTKLKDGLSMGCAFNHAVLDGTSTWHFMSSWAQICRGSSSISLPPFLDRTKSRNTKLKLNLSKPADAPEHAKLNGTDTVTDNCDSNSIHNDKGEPPLKERVFKFSESDIDRIKSKVNSQLSPAEDGSKPFSTFQCLSSHIWKAVTRARQLKPEDYTVFTVFADCRKRLDPPMPESYFGNLIQAIFTVTAAGLLLAHPLRFGADLIQKAIEKHDAKAIEERNKEWESSPKIFQYKDAGANCVAVGSSPRFMVYDIDFGFGRPESVRSGSNNRFDGMVYLYPGKTGGRSIDVEISLESNAMERLENDKEFLLLLEEA